MLTPEVAWDKDTISKNSLPQLIDAGGRDEERLLVEGLPLSLKKASTDFNLALDFEELLYKI